jgi:hypothetical protein
LAVFRVEKTRDYTVMSNHHLRNTNLTLKAKGLMSLMLSLPDTWDYTTKGLACICKDGVDSISSTLSELERNGYLTRERLRDAQGRLGEIVYTIHEKPIDTQNPDFEPFSPKRDFPVQVKPVQVKPRQDTPGLAEPVQEKPAQLSKDISNTELSNTKGSIIHQSIQSDAGGLALPGECKPDRIDKIDRMDETPRAYRELIMENVEYEFMAGQYGAERMDEVVELIWETVLSKRGYIRIAGDEFPQAVVKSRLLKVTSEHVQYVFDCMDNNPADIHNIKAYLLTSLYNAPATMDSYFRAKVKHDMRMRC